MSSASIIASYAEPPLQIGATNAAPRWSLGLTAIVVALVFFLAGHDLRVSLAEAYTQNAEEMEIAAGGGNTLRRVAFLALGGWGGALLIAARTQVRTDPLLLGSLTAFLGLTAISFVWSDDPAMASRRLFTLACCTVATAGIARTMSLRELCWLAICVLGGLAVVGLAAEIALGTFRPWASGYRFAGTVHPNTQGPALATVCFAALGLTSSTDRHRLWLWLVVGVSLVLLVLTKSRSATAATLLGLVTMQVIKFPLKTKSLITFAAVFVAALGVWSLWVLGIDPLNDFRDALLLGRAEEADTLSGRAFIWPEVLSYISQRPLLGYGYESFWTAGRIEQISAELGWGLREAHNAYLEILLNLGIIGLALLLVVAASGVLSSVRGWQTTGDAAFLMPLGLIGFSFINAGFESGMVAISLVPFVLGCCLLRLALFREGRPAHA